jgi:type III secretory pathway component EscS
MVLSQKLLHLVVDGRVVLVADVVGVIVAAVRARSIHCHTSFVGLEP